MNTYHTNHLSSVQGGLDSKVKGASYSGKIYFLNDANYSAAATISSRCDFLVCFRNTVKLIKVFDTVR